MSTVHTLQVGERRELYDAAGGCASVARHKRSNACVRLETLGRRLLDSHEHRIEVQRAVDVEATVPIDAQLDAVRVRRHHCTVGALVVYCGGLMHTARAERSQL